MGTNVSWHLCCEDELPPTPPPTPPRPPSIKTIKPVTTSPFSRSGIHKGNPLDQIRGFEKELLVSLEEALEPFDNEIDHLPDYIKDAKTNCHYPSENGLTRDESAAIYIYTNRWGDGCVYDRLQAAWESKNPSEMQSWFKFLKLFKSAYDKLPDADGEVWQGKAFDSRLKDELDSESTSLYAAMDVFSSSKSSVVQHLNSAGVGNRMLIGFERIGAKLPGPHAANKKYGAVVFPGTKLGVLNIEYSTDDQSVTFHLTGPIREKSVKKPPPVIEEHYVCSNPCYSCSIFTEP